MARKTKSRPTARLRGFKPLDPNDPEDRPVEVPRPAPAAVGTVYTDKHGIEWVLVRNDPNVEADLRVLSVPDGHAHRKVDDVVTLSVRQIDCLQMRRKDEGASRGPGKQDLP